MRTEVHRVKTPQDLWSAVARGVEVLGGGGLVAFPTETVYGLAAGVASAEAMARLREVKQRPDRPFTVHIGRREQVADYVADPSPRARWLMRKAWPGPVTVVLPTDGRLARDEWNGRLAERVCHEGKVALRFPDHPVAQGILAAVGDPVVVPSANLAGAKPPTCAEDVLAVLKGRIDLVIDAGPARLGMASSIVAFDSEGRCQILREGAYESRTLEAMMCWQILFVCTGNTCRSPIGEGLARLELSRRLGCRQEQLPEQGWRVISAGTVAFGGSPASGEAVQVATELGAKIAGHQNQALTAELINLSDLIFCMAGHHLQEVIALSPSAAPRACLLDAGGDIADPIGASVDVYRDVAGRIHRAILARMDTILGSSHLE